MGTKLLNQLLFSLTTCVSGYLFYIIYLKIQLKKITRDKLLLKVMIFMAFEVIYFMGVKILNRRQITYDYRENIKQILMGISIGGGVLSNLAYHRSIKNSN